MTKWSIHRQFDLMLVLLRWISHQNLVCLSTLTRKKIDLKRISRILTARLKKILTTQKLSAGNNYFCTIKSEKYFQKRNDGPISHKTWCLLWKCFGGSARKTLVPWEFHVLQQTFSRKKNRIGKLIERIVWWTQKSAAQQFVIGSLRFETHEVNSATRWHELCTRNVSQEKKQSLNNQWTRPFWWNVLGALVLKVESLDKWDLEFLSRARKKNIYIAKNQLILNYQ